MINMEELKRANEIVESLNRLKIIQKKLYDGTHGYRFGLVDAYADDGGSTNQMFINSLSERYCNWFMEIFADECGDLDSALYDMVDSRIKSLQKELSKLVEGYE